MSRVAKDIICKEDDIKALNMVVSNPDSSADLVNRCRIILMANQGCSNKEISEELGVTQNLVGNWRTRYLEEGFDGLLNKPRSGRKGGSVDTTLDQRFLEAVQDKDKEWSAESLAEFLGISVESTRNLLRKYKVSLQRVRLWTIETADELTSRCMDIVGLYLTKKEQAIIIHVSESPEFLNDSGAFFTRSRVLAGKLKDFEEKGRTMSLNAVLDGAVYYMNKLTSCSSYSLTDFVNDVIDGLPQIKGSSYYLIACSDQLPSGTAGLHHPHVFVNKPASADSWMEKAFEQIDRFCDASEAVSAEQLKKSIRQYLGSCRVDAEPFVWKKNAASEEKTEEEIKEPMREEESLDAGKPSISVTVKYTDSLGNSKQFVNTVQDNVPDIGSIDFSNQESLMNNVANLEGISAALTNMVSQQIITATLDGVKKTT